VKTCRKLLIFWCCYLFTYLSYASSLEAGLSALERGHYGTALRALLPLANDGDANAQVILGNLYEQGLGVKQSYESALAWYQKAGDQDSPEGQYNAGLLYFNGTGVAKDYRAAYEWFNDAADAGSIEGAYMLGVMYHEGHGVPINFEQARHWFLTSAKQGYANAQLMYAFMLQAGFGAPSDPAKAMVWAKIAEINGAENSIKVSIPSSMTLSDLEVETAEKIAAECLASEYQKCPE
jgi:TPR repeat protein